MFSQTERRSASVLIALFVILLACGASGEEVKKVMIVHSYEDGHICGQPQHEGVVEALEAGGWEEGRNLEIHSFFMDTKRTYTTPEQINERGKLALKEIAAVKPDLVLTLDDNAARTVMLPLAGSETPVVFCGMNGQPESYNELRKFMESRKHPGGNITGVYEKLHAVTSIKVVKGVLPDMKKVVAITDMSPTGNAITVQLEKELQESPPVVPCEIVRVKDFAEFQDLILNRVNEDSEIGAIYSMVLRVEAPDGKIYTAPEVFKWQVEHCKKPSMALNYFFAKLGLFGGASVDFRAMGSQAGVQASKILRGEKPGNLEIEDARKYAIVFNTARARDLGIDIPFEVLGAADFVYDSYAK